MKMCIIMLLNTCTVSQPGNEGGLERRRERGSERMRERERMRARANDSVQGMGPGRAGEREGGGGLAGGSEANLLLFHCVVG